MGPCERRRRPGGIRGLADLLNRYAEVVEADLLDQGIDLVDFYRGRVTLRRVVVALRQLPAGARLWKALAPKTGKSDATPGDAAWTGTEHKLAAVFDAVQNVTHVLQVVHSEKGKAPAAPNRMPRPGDLQRARAKYGGSRVIRGSDADLAARLGIKPTYVPDPPADAGSSSPEV